MLEMGDWAMLIAVPICDCDDRYMRLCLMAESCMSGTRFWCKSCNVAFEG